MEPTTASNHLFATCAPPLTLPLADIVHPTAPRPPAGGRRPAFLSRAAARTAARAAVASVLPLVPTDWQPRKAIAATREFLGEDNQPPPPAPRRFKVATPFPLAGYLENPSHQRTVRRRSLGALLIWPLLAAALLGLGGAGTEARGQAALSGSGLSVSFANGSGGISALQYNGNEYYRLGSFVSDWGLQTGTNTGTYVLNSANGPTGQPMSLLSSTPSTVTFTGTYAVGGANVALTRSYTLLAGSPVLRTSLTLQNLSGVAVDLRSFETYDVDYAGGGYETYNDRLLVSGKLAGQSVRQDGYAVVIGSADPATIVSAADRFGFGSGSDVNTFFSNGGTDSNGTLADRTIDIGFDLPLGVGAVRTFVYDQAYGSTASAAQTAFFGAPVSVPEPSTWAMALGGLGLLLLLQKQRRFGACRPSHMASWTVTVTAGAMALGHPTARAQERVVNGNFEAGGSTPTGWAFVNGDGSLARVTGQNSPFTRSYPAGNAVTQFTDGTNPSNIGPSLEQTFTGPAASTLRLAFDFRMASLPGNGWVLLLGNDVGSSTTFLANFAFDDNASHSLTLDSQPLTTLTANTWYHVQADANFLTHSTSGSVTAFGGSPVPFSVVPFTSNQPTLNYLGFYDNNGAGLNGVLTVDNFSVQTIVPEPSAYALAAIGLGTLTGVARRRVRRRA